MLEQTNTDIIVVGSLNMDLVVTTARLPSAGETVAGYTFKTFGGGKGFNQAMAASRAGASTVMIGKLGQDDFGNELEAALQQENIIATHVTRCPDPKISTGIAVITVDRAGRNSIVVVPGTNFELNETDIDVAAQIFQKAKILLLQLEVPLTVCQHAAQIARQYGLKVMLTPAPVPATPLPATLLANLDWLILNETEVRQLADLHCPPLPSDLDETEVARQLLQTTGLASIIVTLGERGAVWVTSERTEFSPAFQVMTVDTTAAGDTFAGALAAALAQNSPPVAALRFANAAAALSVTLAGAATSIPAAPAIKAFLEASLSTNSRNMPQ